MKFKKRWLFVIPLALLTSLSLAGCGNQEAGSSNGNQVKTIQMTNRNINGGNANHKFRAVHSISDLKKALYKNRIQKFKIKKGKKTKIAKVIKPRVILINSSLNGNSNDTLQDREQNEETKLGNEITQLQQKPQIKNKSISGMSQKEQNALKRSNQQKWQNQKNRAHTLQGILKNKQQNYKELDSKRTQATSVKIPSNTTIVGSPNTQMQNVTFKIKGSQNVVIRNLNMQAPSNYNGDNPDIKNDSILINHVDGVKLDHDTFTDSTTNANQNVLNNRKANNQRNQNKNGKNQNKQDQNADSLTDITGSAKHVVITHSRYTDAHKAILIGNPENQNAVNGHIQVTINRNLFEDVGQNAPQVDEGTVHLIHNYYSEDNVPPYKFSYGLGFGPNAILYSNKNTFNINNENSKKVAKYLIKTENNQPGRKIVDKDMNINGQNYKYVVQDNSLQVKNSNIKYAQPEIDPFYQSGSILGENKALK